RRGGVRPEHGTGRAGEGDRRPQGGDGRSARPGLGDGQGERRRPDPGDEAAEVPGGERGGRDRPAVARGGGGAGGGRAAGGGRRRAVLRGEHEDDRPVAAPGQAKTSRTGAPSGSSAIGRSSRSRSSTS